MTYLYQPQAPKTTDPIEADRNKVTTLWNEVSAAQAVKGVDKIKDDSDRHFVLREREGDEFGRGRHWGCQVIEVVFEECIFKLKTVPLISRNLIGFI